MTRRKNYVNAALSVLEDAGQRHVGIGAAENGNVIAVAAVYALLAIEARLAGLSETLLDIDATLRGHRPDDLK